MRITECGMQPGFGRQDIRSPAHQFGRHAERNGRRRLDGRQIDVGRAPLARRAPGEQRQRVARLCKSGSGWRKDLALWFRHTLLAPFDRSGGHG